jgi:hypothetical protein
MVDVDADDDEDDDEDDENVVEVVAAVELDALPRTGSDADTTVRSRRSFLSASSRIANSSFSRCVANAMIACVTRTKPQSTKQPMQQLDQQSMPRAIAMEWWWWCASNAWSQRYAINVEDQCNRDNVSRPTNGCGTIQTTMKNSDDGEEDGNTMKDTATATATTTTTTT